jgi:hypothetical protein
MYGIACKPLEIAWLKAAAYWYNCRSWTDRCRKEKSNNAMNIKMLE